MEGVINKINKNSTNFAITTGSWKCIAIYRIIPSIDTPLFSFVSKGNEAYMIV